MSHPSPESLRREAAAQLAALRNRTLTPKDRLTIPPQPMPSREPTERIHDVQEVALGYSPEQARLEALRCLQCKNAPCINGCPVRINIPAFLKAIAEERDAEAIAIIRQTSLLPAVCGRVCPQEIQCQERCTVGKALKDVRKAVSIGRLERFVADVERESGRFQPPPTKPETGRRVAVIGSGPAGITVAADVRREGHTVTLFEALHKPGGVLVYGIPEFRLPKAIVELEIETLRAMGVDIRPNFLVGRTRRLEALLHDDGYDAAFIGAGAGLPRFLDIEGENLVGVFSANEYLTRANLMRAYNREQADTPIYPGRNVIVVGGGNVAMDAARMALRLGAKEVHLVYRRTEAEMPARIEEIEHAKEEGVQFHVLHAPRRVIGNAAGRVTGLECIRCRLGEPDDSGRPRPVEIPGSEYILEAETLIVAIGNEPNPLLPQTTTGLKADRRGRLLVDPVTNQTSLPRVYAGGDVVLGSATVILAMGQGRQAAAAINAFLAELPPRKA